MSEGPIHIILNGEPRTLEGPTTLSNLLDSLGLGLRRVAVEKNRTVIPRAQHAAEPVEDGDTIEIVHFVGGG